jgi:hypothetical protein
MRLALAIMCGGILSCGRASGAFLLGTPINTSHVTQWLSFGMGAGAVLPLANTAYGLAQGTLFDHLHLGYQWGVNYNMSPDPLSGQIAYIQGISAGYHLFWENGLGVFAGWHREVTGPNSPRAYTFNNQSLHAYVLAKLEASAGIPPSVMYLGTRYTQFDSYRFKTGDSALLQLVAGTHFHGGGAWFWLNNVFTEITVEMSDFGAGSGGENLFGMNVGVFI